MIKECVRVCARVRVCACVPGGTFGWLSVYQWAFCCHHRLESRRSKDMRRDGMVWKARLGLTSARVELVLVIIWAS